MVPCMFVILLSKAWQAWWCWELLLKISLSLNAMANSFTKGLTRSINLNRVTSKQRVVSLCNEKARTSFTICSCSFLVTIFHHQVFLAGGCPAGDSSKSGDTSIMHFSRPKFNCSLDCSI